MSNSSYEILGYFEELIDVEKNKSLGTMQHSLDFIKNRKVGIYGAESKVWDKDVIGDKGHKKGVTLKTKGRLIMSIVYPLCGEMIREA